MKQKIVSATVLFVGIVLSITLFKSVFGAENSLVAVTGITAALSLLGTDFTINPVKNTIYFVCLEVILGIAAFLSSLNAVLGLIITFGIVFYILYTFTYDSKQPIYVGFTLGYFFMLYSPVPLSGLPLRLLGLAVWGLLIMLLQFIVNTNSIKKISHSQIQAALKSLQEQLAFIEKGENTQKLSDLNLTTHKTIKGLLSKFYEYIDRDAKLPIRLFQELFIGHFLDSLNIQLKKLIESNNVQNTSHITALSVLLNHIDLFLNNKEDLDSLIAALDHFLSTSDFTKSQDYLDLELNASATILKNDLTNTKSNDLSQLYSEYFITNLSERLRRFKNNISRDSSRFTFAFRGALITSIGVFIVGAFNLEDGKWIIFSLHAIVQPFSDYSKSKGNQRLIGTVIGLVIFEVIFSIFTSTSARSIIILLVGYLSNYQRNYAEQVIYMTISALGAASIGSNIQTVGLERLVYVVVGSCVALYANKVILPFNISDALKSNLTKSINYNKKIISALYEKCLGKTSSRQEINTLIHVNKFVNRKIEYNNQFTASKDINNFIYNQHILMNDIRILHNTTADINPDSKDKVHVLRIIKSLADDTLSKEEILDHIKEIEIPSLQVILMDLFNIKENISDSVALSESAIKSI